jgi:multicomponent Na+:H+ antiporter subunit D
MSLGAVLQQTGTACASGLGGLRRAMPWTAALCCVGALGMSAPGFCSFASKSLILGAAADEHLTAVYFVLLAAAVGVFFAAGLRVPYLAFFAAPAVERKVAVREAPWNMRIAMLATAALVVAAGVFPARLYALLPHPPDYQVYTLTHVVTQLQLLAFAGLAFAVLTALRVLPAPRAATHLDVDWIYRRLIPALGLPLLRGLVGLWNALLAGVRAAALPLLERGYRHHGATGLLARTWPTGSMALWVAALLGAALILYYL